MPQTGMGFANIGADVARAVFSRDAKKNYTYRGLIEHDKGLSNGFHKC